VIRFDNFNAQYTSIKEEINSTIQRVLDSGWFILGKELESFEAEFARYIGSRYCVGVASGTDAITLSLMSLDIGPGDEVITSDMTAFPTIAAIMHCGAIPVVADISQDDGLIDPGKIESKITGKTKVIIPVHLYGQSCDMDVIHEIARKYRLKIVEDCAQSVGATYKGKKTGTIGDVNAFSFYPTKNLGAYGDGGAITTNNETIYQKLLQLRNYGQRVRYYHDNFGINSRLDEIQAAILRVKLKYLEEWNNARRNVASQYRESLASVTCLKENPYGKPVYHLFVVRTPHRDRLMEHLKANGIQSLIHYPVPIHKQKAFPSTESIDNDSYYETTAFADEILSIPIYPELNQEDQWKIIDTINNFPSH
jgi:dTDP-4-amino-4,6-dideoxygalactose transaminase